MVLDHLVLQDAHAGLLHRQAGQRDARIGGGQRRTAKDHIHLFLGIVRVQALRVLDAQHQGVELLRVGNGDGASPQGG